MEWINRKNNITEKWTISDSRGCSTPNEARTVPPNNYDLFLTIKDADLVKSLKGLLASYRSKINPCKIDLAVENVPYLKGVSKIFHTLCL